MVQFSFAMCSGGRFGFLFRRASILLAICLLPNLASAMESGMAKGENVLQAISVEKSDGLPSVQIKTEKPVGYRYTVYDSYDPVRVVIDFPGMDVSAVKDPIKVSVPPLQEIRTGSFDLASGQLGRVELLLTSEVKYKVNSVDKIFSVSFADAVLSEDAKGKEKSGVAGEKPVDNEKPATKKLEEQTKAQEESPAVPARAIDSVQLQPGRAVLAADGKIGRFQYFHLKSPPRLVLDVYQVKPAFKERSYRLTAGFKQLRVGTSGDKTRFVFDAAGVDFPVHKVDQEGNSLVVSWGGANQTNPEQPAVQAKGPAAKPADTKPAVPAAAPATAKNAKPGAPVVVEGVDFKIEDGKSVLTVSLSGPAEVAGPTGEGNTIRFGIRNAKISRALRRTIDTSAFPSAIKRIIPYTVAEKNRQEVRFAAELKGQAPYSLDKKAGQVRFLVDNNGYAEPAPMPAEMVTLPASAVTPAAAPVPAAAVQPTSTAAVEPAVASFANKGSSGRSTGIDNGKKVQYNGEKISLVFDDANIRNILQLIGEVSNLNIIAGEDVKGTITLRLVDVPWDQALDLILETKGLGMVREGNVVRIMPKEQIRAMRQAEMTAVKEERQLEPVVTEVIPISYTALGNISGPAKELLTERGKITEDARNKQIIVTDIPSVISQVKNLSAILDTPERQVMIEARIVEASSSFSRDLGVKWGFSYQNDAAGPNDLNTVNIGMGGSFLISPPAAGSVIGGAGLGSGITFGRVGIDSTILDLRISALESSGYGKVISTPRVSTLNGGEATISQGTKIPYQSSGSDGLPKTEFVDANLELKVKPVINPDNSIILDIAATNSSIGSTVSTGAGTAPAIDTKEAKTKVLVRNGETTVIGGIFVESDNASEAGVPLLMKIPILGHLLKSENKTSNRSELLVFITPRIVQ